MNINTIRRITSLIRRAPAQHLHMHHWKDDCGTAFCIGGWAIVDKYGSTRNAINAFATMCVNDEARAHMGISDETSTSLFFDYPTPTPTKAQVLRTLVHLSNTGEVDWEKGTSP